jgi:hypothetical protein
MKANQGSTVRLDFREVYIDSSVKGTYAIWVKTLDGRFDVHNARNWGHACQLADLVAFDVFDSYKAKGLTTLNAGAVSAAFKAAEGYLDFQRIADKQEEACVR